MKSTLRLGFSPFMHSNLLIASRLDMACLRARGRRSRTGYRAAHGGGHRAGKLPPPGLVGDSPDLTRTLLTEALTLRAEPPDQAEPPARLRCPSPECGGG